MFDTFTKAFLFEFEIFFHLSIFMLLLVLLNFKYNIRQILLENYKISGYIGAAYRIEALQENGVHKSVQCMVNNVVIKKYFIRFYLLQTPTSLFGEVVCWPNTS